MRKQFRTAGCDSRSPSSGLTSFSALVRDYRKTYQHTNQREWEWFAGLDWPTALEKAALCRWKIPGEEREVRHPHQRRAKLAILKRAHARLSAVPLRNAKSFDDLHQRIHEAIGGISGIGPLTVYDISIRLAAHLGLEPQRIYLHAGAREGAKALGLSRGRGVLEVDELPAAFHQLPPRQIEDCLCIYKDALKAIHGAEAAKRR